MSKGNSGTGGGSEGAAAVTENPTVHSEIARTYPPAAAEAIDSLDLAQTPEMQSRSYDIFKESVRIFLEFMMSEGYLEGAEWLEDIESITLYDLSKSLKQDSVSLQKLEELIVGKIFEIKNRLDSPLGQAFARDWPMLMAGAKDAIASRDKIDQPESIETLGERRSAGEMKVIGASKQQKIDVSLDVLEDAAETRAYDPASLNDINALSPLEAPAAQPEAYRTFATVLTVIMAVHMHDGSVLNSPADLAGLSLDKRFKSVERLALEKLKQALEHADSPLTKTLTEKWPEYHALAERVSPAIKGIEELAKNGLDEPIDKKDDSVIAKVKRVYKKHPYLTAGAIAVGAVAGFALLGKICNSLFSSDATPEKPQQENGFMGKLWEGVKWGGLALLGAFTFGWLKKKAPEWMGIKKRYESLAETIEVDAESLDKLRNVTFTDFMKRSSDLDSTILQGLTKIPVIGSQLGMLSASDLGRRSILGFEIPGTGVDVADVGKVRESLATLLARENVKNALQKYHIDPNDKDTTLGEIFDVLNKLSSAGTLDDDAANDSPEGAGEKDPSFAQDPDDEGIEMADKSVVYYSAKARRELKEKFGEARNVRKVFERYEKLGWAAVLTEHARDFLEDLVVACKLDGLAVALDGAKVIITNGADFFVLATLGTLYETFKVMLQAAVSDQIEALDAAAIYWEHVDQITLAWFGLGALIGGAQGIGKEGVLIGGLKGGISGAAKGLFFPITGTYKGMYRPLKYAWEGSEGIRFGLKRFTQGPEMTRELWMRELRRYSEQYKSAHQWLEWSRNPTNTVKGRWARLFQAEIEADVNRAGRRFCMAYNSAYADVIEASDAAFKAGAALPGDEPYKKLLWQDGREGMIERVEEAARYELKNAAQEQMGRMAKHYAALKAEQARLSGAGKVAEAKKVGDQIDDLAKRFEKDYGKAFEAEIKIGAKQAASAANIGDLEKIMADESSSLDDALKIQGRQLEVTPRLSKFWDQLKKFAGPAAAAATIYYIETEPDKKKALAETALAYAGFGIGATAMEHLAAGGAQLSRHSLPAIKAFLEHPKAAAAILIVGGIASAYGLSQGLHEMVEEYVLSFPGAVQISKETLDVIEGRSKRFLVRFGVRKVAEGGLEKVGLKRLSGFFTNKIGSNFGKKLAKWAARMSMKNILKSLGWKGAATAALLADDATVIGVVDDIVAVGFMGLMAKDIYDIYDVASAAYEVNSEMDKRQKFDIASFAVIVPPEINAQFQETVGRIEHGEDEEMFMNTLKQFPFARVAINRVGISGHEEWTFSNGDATGISIFSESGRKVAEVQDLA